MFKDNDFEVIFTGKKVICVHLLSKGFS